MKIKSRIYISLLLILTFTANIIPCGPGYLTPIFDYKRAPENPYENFAAGNIGILKPTYHRSVLFVAYRYFNGGSFTAAEQKALVDVWNADFNNKDYVDDGVSEAVKQWLEERKDVVGKEEKIPEIYVERSYGGYDFFPNCTKNAFETAAKTLKDRKTSHGSDNRDVKEWVNGQDTVFTNCASGKQDPNQANAAMPEWLQKDRAYQSAAAAFYSLDYDEAKRRFAEIAQDLQSPWQRTAEYLVGRTLIRQASLTKDSGKSKQSYKEAEDILYRISTGSGEFSKSAENLLGLIKYRLYPEQRVRELAQKLSYQGGEENFRQNLIDYTWLIDKFENKVLESEDKRKTSEKPNANTTANSNYSDKQDTITNVMTNVAVVVNSSTENSSPKENQILIYFYTENYEKSWTIYVDKHATDEEAIAEAERVSGMPLTEKMKQTVREGRKNAYAEIYSERQQDAYPDRYYGEEKTSLSILPQFLREDDLTDWLFTYQIKDNEAYLHALQKFKQNKSDLWLATAISKAEPSSTGLNLLLEAADKINYSAPAYLTITFHRARLFHLLNKPVEARKLIDSVLNSNLEIPISTKNQFLELRTGLAETLDDYLRHILRKPFAFDYDGSGSSIEEIIANSKSYYDPEYNKQSREDFEREIDEEFSEELKWQNRLMLDDRTVEIINQHFPTELLLQAAHSSVLPDYQRERFLTAVFVRSLLLQDFATAQKVAPEIIKLNPDLKSSIDPFLTATPNAKKYAALYLILKNENFSPFVKSGLGSSWEQPSSGSRWWCALYEDYYDEKSDLTLPRTSMPKPSFISAAQSKSAQNELAKLKKIGDAPKYLAESVFEWTKTLPRDPRIPESLFIVYESNNWDKYGCGGNEDLRKEAAKILKTRYPNSEWTRQIVEDVDQ